MDSITKALNNRKIMQGSMNATVMANSCIKNECFKISLNSQVSRHDKHTPLKRNLVP
jgi:hypothetical protein